MNIFPYYWMNKFFEWIFLPYYWMNFWMNKKSATFIGKMNNKCVLRKKTAHFACFHCFLKLGLNNFWIIFEFFELNNFLNEYFLFNFELNIELNHFLARFNVKMNNQNVPPTPRAKGGGRTLCRAALEVRVGCSPFSILISETTRRSNTVVCKEGEQGWGALRHCSHPILSSCFSWYVFTTCKFGGCSKDPGSRESETTGGVRFCLK